MTDFIVSEPLNNSSVNFYNISFESTLKNGGADKAPPAFTYAPIKSSIPIYPLSPPRQMTVQ